MSLESTLSSTDNDLLKLSKILDVGNDSMLSIDRINLMKTEGSEYYNKWYEGKFQELYAKSQEFKRDGKILCTLGLCVLPTGYFSVLSLPLLLIGTFQLIDYYRTKKILAKYD